MEMCYLHQMSEQKIIMKAKSHVKSPKRPRYWYCLIGPIPDDRIHCMGDGPPRAAARNAVLEMTRTGAPCSSGWLEEGEAKAHENVNRTP